jgi:hypothetical protein
MVVIAASLGTTVYAPALRRFEPHNWVTAVLLVAAVTLFGVLLAESLRYADRTSSCPQVSRAEEDLRPERLSYRQARRVGSPPHWSCGGARSIRDGLVTLRGGRLTYV